MVRGQQQRIPAPSARMNNMVVRSQQQQNQQMAQTHQTAVPPGIIYVHPTQVFAYGNNNANFLPHKNTVSCLFLLNFLFLSKIFVANI